MKYLIDTSPAKMVSDFSSQLVIGQLLTPLTAYKYWGGVYAIDNGAYSSGLNVNGFLSLLRKNDKKDCLFVAVPDSVGDAKETMKMWVRRGEWLDFGWPLAFVAQNGAEITGLPWDELDAVFIGGLDPWKDSRAAQKIVECAIDKGKHVHVGRVNTIKRYRAYSRIGAHTCDGSGVSRFRHMLRNIEQGVMQEELF